VFISKIAAGKYYLHPMFSTNYKIDFVGFICATMIVIQLAIFLKDKSLHKNNIFQHNINNKQTQLFSNILFLWMALDQNY